MSITNIFIQIKNFIPFIKVNYAGLFIFILIKIPVNTIINVINTAKYKLNFNSYFKKLMLLNLYASSIKRFEQNSETYAGKTDKGLYI